MSEERARILQMVSDNKIDAQEAARLLGAIDSTPEPDAEPARTGRARWFRVRVTDLETGRTKVNVNLPMSLVDVGTRMGVRFAPELEDMDFHDIIEQVKSGAQGKIVEVEDIEDGERVEIYVE